MDNFHYPSAPLNSPEALILTPNDIARIRQVFEMACFEKGIVELVDQQRIMAEAILASYKSNLSKEELLAAALQLAR